MNVQEVRKYLDVIKRAVTFIEKELGDEVVEPKKESSPKSKKSPDLEWQKLRNKHIDDLLAIDVWPEAVPAFLATKEVSDQDQIHRANAVLDMMLDRDVQGLDFLDFGCGEGWITQQALDRGVKRSVGYDIKRSDTWDRLTGPTFTESLPHGDKFDVIMLYDVLDHCEDPVAAMQFVRGALRPNGTVYVRCHPWTSRHGNHLYKMGLNKAYIHLFLTPEEQANVVGETPMFTRQEMQPMKAYYRWFQAFEIKKERLVTEPVHEFFFNPAFVTLLSTEQGMSEDVVKGLMETMKVQFADFVLASK